MSTTCHLPLDNELQVIQLNEEKKFCVPSIEYRNILLQNKLFETTKQLTKYKTMCH